MFQRVSCLATVVLLFVVPVPGADLQPAGVDAFFVVPDRPAAVRWKTAPGELLTPLPFTIRDYGGKEAGAGRAEIRAGEAEATLTLGTGFYELEFPATKQRFGVVALPAFRGKPDPFFALDGALSWLVRDGATRQGLVRAAGRCGIPMIRERLTWGGVHSAAGRWDWDAGVKFDALRQDYRRLGVQVMEMAHDAPAWMGRVGKYPEDLSAAARSWAEIARRWRPAWGALEIWNEPDIFFGDNLPADQYVPLVRAIDYRLSAEKAGVPVVGGVMAHHHREFLETAARNGLLDAVDAFSFHTYGRAMEMEPLVARYREWLEERQRPSMPLWITECGRPWKRGPERPPADQDAQSALDITMKAVEARACGIARYFAFVYPYYDENENNFGMMDRRATPLRSMAAYAQAARTLADAEFLGDLKTADKAVLRSRVFGKGAETIAVVYAGKPDPAAKVKLDLPVLRAEGIDGRPIPAAAGGFLSVPDGLAYLWLDQRAAASRLDPKVPAMRLWERGRQPFERLRKPSPVVLRYQFDRQQAEPSARGYRLKAAPVGKLRVPVKAFNVGDEPVKLDLRLDVDGGQPVASPAGPLAVPSGGAAETAWEVDLAAAFARRGRAWIRVEASDAAAPGAEHRRGPPALAFELFDEANLQATLSQFPGRPQLPIQDLDRWKPAVSGNAAAQGPRSSR